MAENNLKDFTVNWVIFGLLFTALLSFTLVFISANNPSYGLSGELNTMITDTKTASLGGLSEVENEANELLNITSKTNPETSYLGSRDSVATSYKSMGSAKAFWSSAKTMIGWVFTGDVGKIIISTFSGLIGFLAFYFGYKFIRSGN